MKIYILLFVLLPFSVAAQISANIAPKSRDFNQSSFFSGRVASRVIDLPSLDNTYEAQQADLYANQNCPGCRVEYFGKNIPVDINVKLMGERIDVDGGVVYIVKLESSTARSLQLRFSNFDIPPGATLHLYSETSNLLMGAFTSANLNQDRRFFTGIFPEGSMVLEYFEPNIVDYYGEVIIDGVVHGFRSVSGTQVETGFDASGTCTVDVNCATEPKTDLAKESKAIGFVVAMEKNLVKFGSGFLINSTLAAEYRPPYFMTAEHVVAPDRNAANPTYISDIVVYFKYENSSCGNDAFNPISKAISVQGAEFKSVGGKVETHGECEYTLLELTQNPALYTQVAFLGWDARSATPTGQPFYNIGHPSGDAKKKASTTSAPTMGNWNFAGVNMATFNANWTTGVTEPGSSGSPLLNSAKRVIGILSGGNSRCSDSPIEEGKPTDAKAGPDFFTRLYLAYSKPLQGYQSLKVFLDNGSTGTMYMDTYLSPTPTSGQQPPATGGEPRPCITRSETDGNALRLTLPDDKKRNFGWSVSTDGDYNVVGAPLEKRVYIYKKEGCEFKRKAILAGDDDVGRFGYAVDIHGDYVAVGDPGNGTTPGYLYIFRKDGENWVKTQKITTSIKEFAMVVSIWENHVIVGSPGHLPHGRIYIYRRDTNGVWNEIFVDYGESLNKVGFSVEIKRTKAVIGIASDAIIVYDLNDLKRGGKRYQSSRPDQTYWGDQVVISDDEQELFIVDRGWNVIRHFKSINGSFAYSTHINVPNGGWAFNGVKFMSNVSGNYFVAGGYAYVNLFGRNASGTWEVLKKEVQRTNDRNERDRFGQSFAISKNSYFLAGSPEPEDKCTYSGSVYIYDLLPLIYGTSGDLQVCNKTFSGSQNDIYANNIAFGGTSCTTTFASGGKANYFVYNRATLGQNFSAKPGSSLSIKAVPGCVSWPNSTAAARVGSSPYSTQNDMEEEVQIETTSVDKMLVYPNPSSGSVYIKSENNKVLDIRFYDSSGLECQGYEARYAEEGIIEVRYDESFKGIYILRITTDKGVSMHKISIE